jgi:hypothetical protein
MHRRYGRRWHRPEIAVEPGRHDRHCRFQRSIVHSADRQSSRRDDATRQSCPPRDRRRWSRSAPRIAQGCIGDPDQPRPDCACTIRTKQRAVPRTASAHNHNLSAHNLSARSSNTQIPKYSSRTRPQSLGTDDRHSAGNGDDEFALPRSLRTQKAMLPRQRLYAYCLPSYCWWEMDRQAIKRPRDQVMIGFPAASTMSRNASGPCLKETARGRNVAGECSNNNEICGYAWNPFEGSHGPGIYCALCSEVNRRRAAKAPLLFSLHMVHPILAIRPANPHAGLFAARIFDDGNDRHRHSHRPTLNGGC